MAEEIVGQPTNTKYCRECGTAYTEKECPLCRVVRDNEPYFYEWILKVVKTQADEAASRAVHNHQYNNKHDMDIHHRGYKNWGI